MAAVVLPQSPHRHLIRARRTAQPQVDPARKKRVQSAKLLGNHQRGMIGQHDATGTHADGLGGSRHMADHDCRGCGRDARHVVVFCQPVALEAPALHMAGQVRTAAQSFRHRASLEDW